VTRFPLKQFRLFPENCDQRGSAAHAVEGAHRMIAEFGERLGAGIRKFMPLPVSPKVQQGEGEALSVGGPCSRSTKNDE
jgi:hypothetical protein